jgi:hypothetical protein
LAFVAVFLALQLFRLPFTPILFEGDHSVHMSNAWRMFLGETAFRDFFLVTFPGTEIYYLTLFKVFGVEQWLLNATIFFLLMGLSAVGLFLSRRILTGWAIYLPVSIFLVIGFRPLGIDGSHRFFSVLAVLTAAAIIFTRRTLPRLVAAGIFCGLASAFTQPRGFVGLAAIISFLTIEKFYTNQNLSVWLKSILAVSIPYALIIGFILIYFIATAGFDNFYYATFVFPVKNYPADNWNNFNAYFKEVPIYETQTAFAYLKQTAPLLFFYFLIPAVYLLFSIVLRLKRRVIEDDKKLQLILINLVGLFLAAGVFSAPNAYRLYQVSIPGLISLIWIFQLFAPPPKIALFFLLALGLLGFSYTVQRQTVTVYPLNTPSGAIVAFSPHNLSRYEWTARNTAPYDYFYEPHHPSLYTIFRLKNPTPIGLIRANDYTTDDQVKQIIRGLELNPPRYIIWNGVWNEFNRAQSSDFHLQPLVDYLNLNYHTVEKLNDYNDNKNEVEYKIEIWEKN